MSIKTKVFFIVAALFILLGGVNFVIQRFIVFPSFLELEEREADENLRRIEHSIDREIGDIDRICRDWAHWDDAYQFATNRSKTFVASNLNDDTMDGIHLNLLAVYGADGRMLWGRVRDPGNGSLSSLRLLESRRIDPVFLAGNQTQASDLLLKGAIATEHGPLLFSSRQLLHTDGSGPGNGFIVMGRFLHPDLLDSLRDQTLIPFGITYPYTARPEQCAQPLRIQFRTGILAFLLLQQGDSGLVCSEYRGIDGRPLFSIHYRVPREITSKGQENVRYAAGLIVAAGVLMLMLLVALLEGVVLRPLRVLTGHTETLARDGDLSRRLNLRRRDEIGVMATSFDSLVQTLEERTEELQRANEQLTQLSMLDGLTGIANRRMFDATLHKEWRRAMREQTTLSLILLDVDHFKPYNDSFGHLRGDQCLTLIAGAMRQCMQRPSDLLARYGGEEFAVVLPNTDTAGALLLAEKLRNAVENLHIPHAVPSPDAHVTISVGVGTMTPPYAIDNTALPALISAADQALYAAKSLGRNHCIARGVTTASGQGDV